VVIETRHGLLVERLLDAGYVVLPVNPDMVASPRGPARKKDDAEGARTACLLALDRQGGGGHRGMPTGPQGQAVEPTKSAIDQGRRPWVGSRSGWLVERSRLGVGHASTVRPDPSTLGAAENEAPTTRAARRPVPGSPRRVFLHRVGCHR
jgi:hypothetical protein